MIDTDEQKYKRSLLKKLREQLRLKHRLEKGESIDPAQHRKIQDINETLNRLEQKFSLTTETSEEVKRLFESAEDRSSIDDLQKKKKKKNDDDCDDSERKQKKQKSYSTVQASKQLKEDKEDYENFHQFATKRMSDERVLGEYSKRVARAMVRFDAFRLCSIQWSLGTIWQKLLGSLSKNAVSELARLRGICASRFLRVSEKADARALATCLWSLAQTISLGSSVTMISNDNNNNNDNVVEVVVVADAIKMAMKKLGELEAKKISTQDGANALWALAKLRIRAQDGIEKVVSRIAEQFRVCNSNTTMKAKEVSSTIWALATLAQDGLIIPQNSSITETVMHVAKMIKKAFDDERTNDNNNDNNNDRNNNWSDSRVVANCVWACTKLSTSQNNHSLECVKVLNLAIEAAIKNEHLWHSLEPRAFATLLNAASTLGDDAPDEKSTLFKRALECFEDTATHGRDITPEDVCDLCEFIEVTKTSTTKSEDERVLKIVTAIAKTCGDWKAAGRLAIASSALATIDARAKKRLLSSGVEAVKIIETDRFNVDNATVDILSKQIEEQLQSKSTKQRRVMIANYDSKNGEAKLKVTIEKFGHRFETWQRFCSASNDNAFAREWPVVSERKCDYAFVRACADKESLNMLLTAVATRVKVGGEVFIAGALSEGFSNAFDAFNKVCFVFFLSRFSFCRDFMIFISFPFVSRARVLHIPSRLKN